MTVTIPTEATGYHFKQCNILAAWEAGFNGTGIVVGMIDDGLAQSSLDWSRDMLKYDWDMRGNDPLPVDESGDGHGDKVANVLFAESDGAGAVGIAYGSDFGVIRIGYGANGSMGQTDGALSMAPGFFDTVNCSWGWSNTWGDYFPPGSAEYTIFENAVKNGRKGLGTVVVFAAGNQRGTGQDVNYHNYNNSPFFAAVAGVDSSGYITYWSDPGAALLCCASGVSIQGAGSGTSFAAPIVTGVVALILEANPNLTWIDVHEIIALTCTKNDPNKSSWKKNGAGRHYSRDYGFGLINAFAAVNLAQQWTPTILQTVKYSGTGSINVSDDFIVQSVEVNCVPVNNLTLTSPAGTNTLLVGTPDFLPTSQVVLTDRSKAGESSKGLWTISANESFSLILRGTSTKQSLTPLIINLIEDIQMTTFTPISVTLPNNVFTDVDGDTLSYSLESANSAVPLPAWLKFDPTTLTISGTPDAVETLNLNLVASDGQATTPAPFKLIITHVNHAPGVVNPIADITVTV